MMNAQDPKKVGSELSRRSGPEQEADDVLLNAARRNLNLDSTHWNYHALVTMKRQVLSRVLYLDMLYQQIINVSGIICEFGVHRGASLATMASLRGIYEPFNYARKVVGFDTFEGFASVSTQDGNNAAVGDFDVPKGYEAELADIMAAHEKLSPIPHIQKHEIIKGDATKTVPKWLSDNPHAVIAMAVLDMDVYEPTKVVLETIKPRLTRGSILVFDELSCPFFPGETTAVSEVFGLPNLRLRHSPLQPYCAWAVIGE